MMANDLIDLALELAHRDGGRPKSVSLRRAASTAYYALFHALAALCADQLIGTRKSWKVFTPIYRSLDHAKARNILNAARQQGIIGSPIETVAKAFETLQEARYDADYNPEPFPHGRSGTIELVNLANRAIAAIGNLSDEDKLAIAVKLVVKSR